MADRDRDTLGKPRNARPRDRLGRPLAWGEEGFPTMPDDLDLEPDEAVTEAQRLLDHDLPFHAHEVLESAWKKAPSTERGLWQGLAQLAVAVTHQMRGNPAGAVSLLRQGRHRIAAFADDPPHALDIGGLVAWADHLIVELDCDAPPDTVPVPRLRVP